MKKTIDAITRTLEFPLPVERVWHAVTEPAEVVKWFGSHATYELKEGAAGFFEWENECAGKIAMKIETIRPFSYFAWRWMQEPEQAFNHATSTLVEWQLTKTTTGTRLTMTESGFAALKQQQLNTQGWQIELSDLQQYLR
ncbi:SRPBCC domain-containing protein [Alteromonas gilva]|uniref:SRPBCC domain-containing protein n=1 Tax=Alteromonas gilva TaxID=2987522 RepID=A0ABT5L367_9ALTE|nr:SRPBCC domain-containing protein [Alteromonas gilva]MDC8831479.1 SRPBCC domain-containing protein [Alteromonas gilva]